MNRIALYTAIYILGARYHSGQWSRGYKLMCLSASLLWDRNSCTDVGRIAENLQGHRLYRQGDTFRNAVARHLKRLRTHRSKM